MAMHRLPAGTEAPRWRVVAAIWVASMILAAALAFAINALTGLHIAHVTTPILWLAVQWAAWLHIKDRPAHPRPFEVEPDESPTVEMAAVEENPTAARPDPRDRIAGLAVDRPAARHALKESSMPEAKPSPVPRFPGVGSEATPTPRGVLREDRFAPFRIERIEEAAIRLQTSRWNFNRIRPMHPAEVRTQWNAMNRYLAEQVRKEAHAALLVYQTDLNEHQLQAEFWDRQCNRMIDWFNPPDGEDAVESICMDAVERAFKFAESTPCSCDDSVKSEDDEFEACARCQVLGRVRDVAVQR